DTHRLIAPGSARLWHPAEPAVADVLGTAARPISIAPDATWRGLVRPARAARLGTASRPISIDPDATWRGLGLLASLVALVLLSAPALSERRTALAVSAVLVANGLALALFGIVSRLLFANLLYGRLAVPTVSPFGPFVSK